MPNDLVEGAAKNGRTLLIRPQHQAQGRLYNYRLFPLSLDGQESGQMGLILWDLTEQKKLQDQLIQSEKLNGLGTLVSGMVHEVRSPMQSILGVADLLLEEENPETIKELAGDLKRVTRHPMLWGVTLFSALHLLSNGDQASVMIFGPFFVYGLLGMWLTDRKKRLSDPEAWERDSRPTSVFPFVAIRQGRAGPPAGDKGLKAVLIGLVVYVGLAYAHEWFIGVALPIG